MSLIVVLKITLYTEVHNGSRFGHENSTMGSEVRESQGHKLKRGKREIRRTNHLVIGRIRYN